MSQWHQFQVTKRNNISYQIYSTKDERLEKLTYSFFGFSIINWIAENEQFYIDVVQMLLHGCCWVPFPLRTPVRKGGGDPQDFGFVTMKFAWFPQVAISDLPSVPHKSM